MSEPQTESKTDTEPTSGPWTNGHGGNPEASRTCKVKQANVRAGGAVADVNMARPQKENLANARLIAAAGTAAQEAKEMGYDPQKAVEALPEGLEAARRAIIDLQEAHTSGPPEDSTEAAAQAASHRLKVFMAEAGADESMIPGDASVALASAEGSEE